MEKIKSKLKRIKKIKEFNILKLKELKNNTNIYLDELIEKYSSIKIELKKENKIKNIKYYIKNYESYFKRIMYVYNYFFKNKKNKFIVVIFLKSNNIDSFEVYENKDIQGFTYNNGYYNIDKDAIIEQNKNVFSFYLEGISSPINFKETKYDKEKDIKELKLSTNNLKNIVNGKAFKGIINLGKESSNIFDWKMILIILGAILIFYLQATGQIDIGQMLQDFTK